MHLFHKYISVVDVDHSECEQCFRIPNQMSKELVTKYPKGYCPHSFRVCKCGKWKGWGSHGKLTLVPDGCEDQVRKMGGKFENDNSPLVSN